MNKLSPILAVLFLFIWSAGPAAALNKLRFQLDWFPDAEAGGYFCALEEGYYKDAGLDVEILPSSPGASSSILGNLVVGNIDLSMAEGDGVMLSRSRGMPLVSIMATMQHDPQAVMVHDDSDVKTLADLDNHTIAVIPGATWLSYLSKKYHYKNIQAVPVGLSVSTFLVEPQYIQQVFVTSEPYVCEQHHVKVRTFLIKDSGYDPYRVVVGTERFLAAHPDEAQAFVTASIRGWKKYLEDPAATNAEILKRNPAMEPGVVAFSRQTLIDYHFITGVAEKGEAIGKLDPARFASESKIMEDLQLLPTGFDYTKALTTQFCDK